MVALGRYPIYFLWTNPHSNGLLDVTKGVSHNRCALPHKTTRALLTESPPRRPTDTFHCPALNTVITSFYRGESVLKTNLYFNTLFIFLDAQRTNGKSVILCHVPLFFSSAPDERKPRPFLICQQRGLTSLYEEPPCIPKKVGVCL